MTDTTLETLPIAAAEYIEVHGWTKGAMENDDGNVCLTGALKACSPKPGDWLLAREVYRKRDRAEGWNDKDGQTQQEVIDELRTNPITDTDLSATFGPQWATIVGLVRRASTFTLKEMKLINKDWGKYSDDYAAWSAADYAACNAADRSEAWLAAWGVSGAAARYATESAAWYASWNTAENAASALSVIDLVGQHGLEQHHIDTLLAPWREVIGDPLKEQA